MSWQRRPEKAWAQHEQRPCKGSNCSRTSAKRCPNGFCANCCRDQQYPNGCDQSVHNNRQNPRGSWKASTEKRRRQDFEASLATFISGFREQVEQDRMSRTGGPPSQIETIFSTASPQAITKALAVCLAKNDWDPLIELVGPAGAKVVENNVPDEFWQGSSQTEAEEFLRTQACSETQGAGTSASAAVQDYGTSASAAVQTEGTRASAAVQTDETRASAAVQAPKTVPVPDDVIEAWHVSMEHVVNQDERQRIMRLRTQMWKVILGGEEYGHDPEVIGAEVHLQKIFTPQLRDRLVKQRCPLPFKTKQQWDEFCAWTALLPT